MGMSKTNIFKFTTHWNGDAVMLNLVEPCSLVVSLAVSLCLVEGLYGIPATKQAAASHYIQGLSVEHQDPKKNISTNFTTWLYHPERSPIKKARFVSPVEGWLFNDFIGPKCCNHLPGLKFEPGIPPGSKALVIRTQGPGHGNGNSPMFNRRYHLQMVVFPLSC